MIKVVAEPPVTALVDEFVTVIVLDPVDKIPLPSDTVPLTETLLVNVTPVALLTVRLLKVVGEVPPIVCARLPLKLIVPVPGVNVPEFFVQFPATPNVEEPPFNVPAVRVTAPLNV